MIKKASIIVLISFVSLTIHGQKDFEGIIKFKLDFRDKTGQMSKEQVKQLLGDEQVYYLKKGKYKAQMNGLLKMTLFYNNTDTLYTKMTGQNVLLYNLVNEDEGEKIVSHEFSDVTETIAGVKCKLFIVKTSKGIRKYYYSNEVKIDPKYYENHKFGLWDYFMKMTNGGVSIKSIADLDDSYQSIEAVSIEKKKIDDTIFERPKNLPLMKAPKN